jgi:hypothetical protein
MDAAAASTISAYIPAVVAAVPALLSPIVVWVLGRSRISRESARIDYFNKRLDFLERLNKLQTQQLAEGPIRPLLDREIEHYRAFLDQPPTVIPQRTEVKAGAPQSRWARFFLTQPAVSVRQRIFKGLFYFFFGTAMVFALGTLGTPIALFSEERPETTEILQVLSFSFVFYLGIALLFRLGAR